MKEYWKPSVLLLSTSLCLAPFSLLAQEENNPSQKASDIHETSPADISEQGPEEGYSQQNLCQIGLQLSKTPKPKKQRKSGPNTVGFDTPDGRKINKGVPLNQVLTTIAKDGNNKHSQTMKIESNSNNCQ